MRFCSRIFKITLLLSLSICFSIGCNIQSPSVQEEKSLIEKGAFPRGVPPWIPVSAMGEKSEQARGGGLIPRSYSAAVHTESDRKDVLEERSKQAAEEKEKQKEKAVVAPSEDVKEEDALKRIAIKCPHVEREVVDAITTTNSSQRIRKLAAVTVRCPISWDVWLWLARDYRAAGRSVEAGRSYDKVLELNSGNQEARSALVDIRGGKVSP